MTIDKKTIAIIILSILALIFGWIAFKPAPENPYNEALSKHELHRLDSMNVVLLKDAMNREAVVQYLTKKNDSLESLKPKIQIIYVNKSKQIDSASSHAILGDFNRIFSANNIK